MTSSRLAAVGALLLIVGCPTEGPIDSPDGSAPCAVDTDCDDDLFCNGEETCDPESSNANARGCVAGTAPCPPERCIEAERRCDTSGCEDADGDGYMDIACGGTDCDDTDAGRFPGQAERCDFVDDDCDPTTVGDRDADGDGVVSSLCCNGTTCGADCDDTQPGVSPTSPEVCNDVDDDCDGATDEGVLQMAWPDGDRDGWGDEGSSVELRCDLPSDRASRGGDCADLDASINPDATDVCDGIDQDCDGMIDEGADELCDDALGPLTVGACVSPPDGSVPRCHGLYCVGGADVCSASTDNRCDANLCMSGTDCGACGEGCLACSDGHCSGGGAGGAIFAWSVRDALADTPVAGATAEPFGSCASATYGMTDASGFFVMELSFPEDNDLDGFRFRATGYLTTLPSRLYGGDAYMLSESEYVAALAAAPTPIPYEPELGVVVIRSSGFPLNTAVAGPAIVIRDDGTVEDASAGGSGLYVLTNVLPGEYTFSPLPDGCSSPDPQCQRLDGVHVEGGHATSLEFVCMSVGCSG
ncbi:MAG: putative metal-binding motif-containing protein [Deltaproteobacteria bacterium]|nr:putative metal-binding motif-containing protein [Deltaproteobacteria bacterium]